MSTSLLTTSLQTFIFMLGCALIHAARDQAVILTRWLASLTAIMAVLTVIAAAMIWWPSPDGRLDEITVYLAAGGQPNESK